jgi:hypothetical protein
VGVNISQFVGQLPINEVAVQPVIQLISRPSGVFGRAAINRPILILVSECYFCSPRPESVEPKDKQFVLFEV